MSTEERIAQHIETLEQLAQQAKQIADRMRATVEANERNDRDLPRLGMKYEENREKQS